MITEALKKATAASHQRVEQLALSDKIMDGSLTQTDYQHLLRSNYRFHQLLESEIDRFLAETASEELSAEPKMLLRLRLAMEQRRKTELLQADLHETGTQINQPEISVLPVRTLSEALGYWYVMEGATLGGAMIVKQLRKNPHLSGIAFHYYGCYGNQTGVRWKSFQQLLIELVDTPEKEAQATGAAVHAFELLETIMQQPVLPFTPTSLAT